MDWDFSPLYAVALFLGCSGIGIIWSLINMVSSKDLCARISWLVNLLFFSLPWLYSIFFVG
jgi:hypothetical protein